MHDPDPRLIEAARSGDLGAFEKIVRAYQADVWRIAVHLLHDRVVAEDVVQEALLRVFRFLPRYRGDSRFSTWLFTIVRNCAYDELRRKQKHARLEGGTPPESEAPVGSSRLEVREAVLTLPGELREAIVWIDMVGLTYAEVASLTGVPTGTVKSRVHRARALLAEALREPHERSGDV